MHVNRQMTSGLVTLRDAKEIAALPGTSVHMAMAVFGSAEPIHAGHRAVRRVEPKAGHFITGRRRGNSKRPDGRQRLGHRPDSAHRASSTSRSDDARSESVNLPARADQPRGVRREPVRSTEPGPPRRQRPGPGRSTEPKPHRSSEPGPRRSSEPRQPRQTRPGLPRYRDPGQPRQRGTGQRRLRTGSALEDSFTRSGKSSPRRTKSPGGQGWPPRCKCSEPAHAMCHIAHLARGSCVPLRTPTAARLSPARGKAGGGGPAPSSRCADA